MTHKGIFSAPGLVLIGLVAGIVLGRQSRGRKPEPTALPQTRTSGSNAAQNLKPVTNRPVANPREPARANTTVDVPKNMTIEEAAAAIHVALGEKDQAKRYEALQKIANAVPIADVQKALALADSIPNRDLRANFVSILMSRWAESDPVAAMTHAQGMANVSQRNQAVLNVLSVWVLAHYASPEKQSARTIVMTLVRNPLIWACAIGLAINVAHLPLPHIWHEVADALGRSSLGIGLLVTGAGLHLEGMFRPSVAASVAVFLKLILMPVLAVALALWFGVSGSNLAIVTACAAVPASSSAYVLARQMGGDAPLLAQIITLQTILAAITMPIAIALAAMC